MTEISNASISNLVISEGLNDVPRMIVTMNSSGEMGYLGKYEEVEVEGYTGFVDSISNKSLYIKIVDPTVFQVFESKYLGNSLMNSIISLNLKSEIDGTFPDISQNFYMIKERPWSAFIRLSRYLPNGYYMACLGSKIKIFKAPDPGNYLNLNISTYITESDYNRQNNNLITLMNTDSDIGNPSYGTLVQVPNSKMMTHDIVKNTGIDVINNYVQNYLNRDSYFEENLMFSSRCVDYNIGDGITLGDVNFMIISKSISMNHSGNANGAYRCIKVS